MSLPTNQRASAVGVDSEKASVLAGANFRPEIMLVIAQAQTGTTETLNIPFQVFENGNYGTKYGFRSPFSLALDSLFTAEDSIETWALPVGDPSGGVAASATITVAAGTVTKSFTGYIKSKGLEVSFVGAKGDDEDAIALAISSALTKQIRIPFTAEIDTGVTDNVVNCEASFKGVNGNEITLEVVDGDGNAIIIADYGVSITVVGFADGAGDVDISDAIANIPDSLKITRIVNQFGDTTALDLIETLGVDRQGALIGERILSYKGLRIDTTSMTTVNAAAITIQGLADTRKLDEVNEFLPCGNGGLPIEQVAELVGRISGRYQSNPGKPPRGINIVNPVNAPKTIFWFSAFQANSLYIGGVSNFEYKNDVFRIMDLCTIYHPEDDTKLNASQPIVKDDEDITATANMLYDMKLIFSSDPWLACKFITENDISSSPDSRRLSDVKATVDNRIGEYVNALFMKDSDYAKKNKIVVFDDSNPEQVNITLKAKLATTGRIYDIVFSMFKA